MEGFYLPSKSHTPTREQIIVRGLCRQHAEFLFCDEGGQVGDLLREWDVLVEGFGFVGVQGLRAAGGGDCGGHFRLFFFVSLVVDITWLKKFRRRFN